MLQAAWIAATISQRRQQPLRSSGIVFTSVGWLPKAVWDAVPRRKDAFGKRFYSPFVLLLLACVFPTAATAQHNWQRAAQIPSPPTRLPAANGQSTDLPEPVAAPRRQYEIPWRPSEGEIEFERAGDLVSLVVRDAAVSEVLSVIARNEGLNIVCADDMRARISVTLQGVTVEDALNAVVAVGGCTLTRHRGIFHVTSLSSVAKLAPAVQGRQTQVFHLDYASADDVNQAIAGMLSPLGSSHVITSNANDNRKTKESIVVEDLPAFLERIALYVGQMDIPPRQVLVQVHVLKVDLNSEDRHGVNFEHIMGIHGHRLNFRVGGFANPGSPQAFFAELDGGNLTSLVEALKTTTDAKTLASPKVLVLNGQEARIQVGEQLGFRITTTTETSTLESVEFLDLGVVLSVTPRISRDNHVLLSVKPEVSSGRVNSDTGLPEQETSEVDTNVLLRNGQGIVIGGLIQETDSNVQSKVPYLGDLHIIGKFFGRRQVEKRRSEIIFVLQPHILPYCADLDTRDRFDVMRSKTPLFHGALERIHRPWEPRLPDCVDNPTVIRLPPIGHDPEGEQPENWSEPFYEPAMPSKSYFLERKGQ